MSLGTVIGVVFIILKFTHVISWPWLWVLAPFWIPWALVLTLFGVVALVAALAGTVKK